MIEAWQQLVQLVTVLEPLFPPQDYDSSHWRGQIATNGSFLLVMAGSFIAGKSCYCLVQSMS